MGLPSLLQWVKHLWVEDLCRPVIIGVSPAGEGILFYVLEHLDTFCEALARHTDESKWSIWFSARP